MSLAVGRTHAIVALVLGGCTSQPNVVTVHASALARWDLSGTIWWHPAPELDAYFGPTGTSGDDCFVLGTDASATLDGTPIDLDPGGLVTDPDTHKVVCSGPKIKVAIPPALTATGSPFDLVIADATSQVHVGVIGAFAARSITLDGGGPLVPGTTATIRWAPTTDELVRPYPTNNGTIALTCTPPIFPDVYLRTSDGTLTQTGNAFSFAVPSTNGQHYMLSCTLEVVVHATLDACDFRSCVIEHRLPGAYDYPFTLSI